MRKKTWLILAAYLAGWLTAPMMDKLGEPDQKQHVVAQQDQNTATSFRLASK